MGCKILTGFMHFFCLRRFFIKLKLFENERPQMVCCQKVTYAPKIWWFFTVKNSRNMVSAFISQQLVFDIISKFPQSTDRDNLKTAFVWMYQKNLYTQFKGVPRILDFRPQLLIANPREEENFPEKKIEDGKNWWTKNSPPLRRKIFWRKHSNGFDIGISQLLA